jgi:N-methylhydantoinase A/acetone carboxylase beta subunit
MFVTGAWYGQREKVVAEFAKSGVAEDQIQWTHLVRMQYFGQLNDLEIVSPHLDLDEPEQLDDLVASFEDAYGKLYARSARSPELGYLITQAIVLGSVPVEKPALPDLELAGESVVAAASKGTRQVRWSDESLSTEILEQDRLAPGNVVVGPAIVESPASTFAIPPGRQARLDQHLIFHLADLPGGMSR